ncbi:hypothetical protein AB0L74_14625 [Streptomyces sp. NPDC052020]|uniref:hypothetical protein n=1 Tax=Streptomyces sp. NPDC052020 TaxID=3155677 RepID=UPI0034271612
MIVVAVLLLPTLALTLLLVDRVEDWLSAPSPVPRHARGRRHLRLVQGGARKPVARPTAASNEGRAEAA